MSLPVSGTIACRGAILALITCLMPGVRADTPADVALPILQRVPYAFDFEEARRVPMTMPTGFVRVISAADAGPRDLPYPTGFPDFGTVALARHTSPHRTPDNQWALHATLDGASIAVRIPTGICPILPATGYAITVNTRSRGLEHAAVRLVAWLHDTEGALIAGSRIESAAIQPNAIHTAMLRIDVPPTHPTAADLVIELQALQPTELGRTDSTAPDAPPRFVDVGAEVWFDDLTITTLPHVDLTAQSSHAPDSHTSVFTRSEPITLQCTVRDATRDPLRATLHVADLSGRIVYEQPIPAPTGDTPCLITTPDLPCGWYRAVVSLANPDGPLTTRTADFVVGPSTHRRNPVFGVQITADDVRAGAPLLERSGVGLVAAPVWDSSTTASADPDRRQIAEQQYAATLRTVLDDLLKRGFDLAAVIPEVPANLVQGGDLTRNQVVELIAGEGARWRDRLDPLLIEFGFDIPWWQLGTTPRAFRGADGRAMVEQAHSALRTTAPRAIPMIPFAADIDDSAVPQDVIRVSRLQPGALDADPPHQVHLTGLSQHQHTPRQGVADSAQRALHAWRAGAAALWIDAPWMRHDHRPVVSPTPMFAAWRTLADRLHHRRFIMPLPEQTPGVTIWLIGGETPADAALVAWDNAGHRADGPFILRAPLTTQAVEVIDIFGEHQTISPDRTGAHAIALTDLPVFIEGIDGYLAAFRSAIAIEPAFLDAEHRMQSADIIIRNPWSVAIGGTIAIQDQAGVTITPRQATFSVAPNGQTRLPVEVLVSRNAIAGDRMLRAMVDVTADRPYHRVAMHMPLEIGLRDLSLRAVWRVAANVQTGARDLVVTMTVTNRGERAVNLNAVVHSPLVGRRQRVIAGLAPGATAVRSVRFADGVNRLSGQRLIAAVGERDGTARLNVAVDVPQLVPSPAAEAQFAEVSTE